MMGRTREPDDLPSRDEEAAREGEENRREMDEVPPPGTDFSASGVSCKWPASEHSGRYACPGSSSSATRSRGSNCPRLSNIGLDLAEAADARSSSARICAMRESIASRRCAATALCAFQLDW